ncbi:hypothetical protein BLOT_000952 [Blomia tropicalis]|nr:hypothetical protein BLOT_000952 [Blomia tropicalis]
MNAQSQLVALPNELTNGIASFGVTSPTIIHGMGPNPSENTITNTIRQTTGIQPQSDAHNSKSNDMSYP